MREVRPSDAELVQAAYEAMCGLEEPLCAIRDYARAIELIGVGLKDDLSGPIVRLAEHIAQTRDAIEEERGRLFLALHPRRGEPGFPDDGNGEIEAAAGDV
jgi:hypothetical protein